MRRARLTVPVLALLFVTAVTVVGGLLAAQAPQSPAAQSPSWLVLSPQGRQTLQTTTVNGREMVSLDELARVFGLEAREDAVTRGIVVGTQGNTIVLSSAQPLASIAGRVVSLSSPPVRSGKTWVVPVDFIDRALAQVHQPRLDVRPRSRVIVVGDARVPRVTARFDAASKPPRLTFDIVPPTPHSVVQEPGRLLVKFGADAIDADLPAQTGTDLVTAVRQLPGQPVVVLELGPRFASFRAGDVPTDGTSQRLQIDFVGQGDTITPPVPTPSAPGAETTPTPAPGEPPLLSRGPAASISTVVIDPGHGGDEGGAKGPGGSLEKNVTIAVGRGLKAAIEARLGVRVLLTREEDGTVKLDERAALANNNKADVFISLHANASVRPSVTGAEVYYLSLDNYSQEAQRQAIQEGGALPSITGGERKIDIILWEMAQVQHIANSATLADLIEQELRTRVKMSERAIQQAPLRVLVGANMPAVLVEMGFISNAGEERLLASTAHQEQIVDAIVASIERFRAHLDKQRLSIGGTALPPTQPQAPPASPGRLPGAAQPVPRLRQ